MASDITVGEARVRSLAALRALPHDRLFGALFVTDDGRLAEYIQTEFAARERFALRVFPGRVSQLAENLDAIELPDVVAVDLTRGSPDEVDTLERLRKSAFANVPVIAISSHLDQHVVRALMQIKVDDWLPAGCQAEELHTSCEHALLSRLEKAGAGESEARCIAFVPASGGCGNTTLAIEAALIVANRDKRAQSTCLVDLNFQDGAIADYLDLTPSFQISELSGMSQRLDRQLLDVMLARHRSGLAVLAPPHAPGQVVDVTEATVGSILGLLSEAFHHLVIDLPKVWSPWTDNVIWGSDRIFVVSGFTVPALRQARLLAESISTKAAPKTEISVLVNKFHEPLMGPGLTRKDAEAILEGRLGGFIPNLGGMVDEAINRGMPISELRSGNKIGKRLAQVLGDSARSSRPGKH
jgi:pilus assembly protein CpaE